ncbi:MAG: hypothetical protein RIC55_18500 [Pirellulaceae bacterium]
MDCIEQAVELLAAEPVCGYYAGQQPAVEPTALAALALAAKSRTEESTIACQWLASVQAEDGSLAVRKDADTPRWPTALAVLAWTAQHARESASSDPRYQQNIDQAITWSLSLYGEALEPSGVHGHDVTLQGWPWVAGTYSWIEPTALHVAALKAAGRNEHPRTREAVRLLIDRQLATGGCNYGNTTVLGQRLRPHVQPTGTALLALAGESDHRGRIQRSLGYLAGALHLETTTTSLCWGLMGLAAHEFLPAESERWLTAASGRLDRRRESPYQRALLILASLGRQCPLVALPREAQQHGT